MDTRDFDSSTGPSAVAGAGGRDAGRDLGTDAGRDLGTLDSSTRPSAVSAAETGARGRDAGSRDVGSEGSPPVDSLRPAFVDDVRLRCAVLHEPKAGSTKSEYEDAYAVPGGGASASAVVGCTVAVADGASESMLAGAWAGMLARSVIAAEGRELDAETFADRVCAAAARWPAYVGRYVRRRERLGRPVTWYEEPKLEQGAYATVLGVSFRRDAGPVYSGGGTWSAAALGDSCGFHVRGSRLAAAFPLESAAEFDTTPHLACTRDPDRDLIRDRTVTRHGTWLPGDTFYLATDAAAQWFLREDEANRQPWRQIDEAFDAPGAWLDELRADRRIRNDDVTIVRCLLEAGAEPEPGEGTA